MFSLFEDPRIVKGGCAFRRAKAKLRLYFRPVIAWEIVVYARNACPGGQGGQGCAAIVQNVGVAPGRLRGLL